MEPKVIWGQRARNTHFKKSEFIKISQLCRRCIIFCTFWRVIFSRSCCELISWALQSAKGYLYYLWIEVWSLLHESSNCEPEAVCQWELILHEMIFQITGMWIVPFIWWEPCHHKHCDGDQNIGCQHIQPDVHCQWIHEAEQAGWLTGWNLQSSFLKLKFRTELVLAH